MTETAQWTPTYVNYVVWCSEAQWSLNVSFEWNDVYLESDVDTGIEGFAAAYSTLHPVINITKSYTATGVSSYDYAYTDGVGADAGDGITEFNEGFSGIENNQT